jgi:hypothetical protein
MIFEFGLSQTVVINLFKNAVLKLEQVCARALSDTLYFDRIELKAPPTATRSPNKDHDVVLSDGTQLTVHSVVVTQHFDVVFAILTPQVGGSTGLGPVTVPASVELGVTMDVFNGDARLCIKLRKTDPDLSDIAKLFASNEDVQNLEQFKKTLEDAINRCIPLRIPDLFGNLSDMLSEKLPFSNPLFKSTDVVNAGLILGPFPNKALLIRVEVEAADADMKDAWTAFFDGSALAAPSPPIDWSMTIDRRLFGRLVSAVFSHIEATASHLEFETPSSHWYASHDLYGSAGPLNSKLVAKGLPTLTSSIEGKAVGVCEFTVFGQKVAETDLDFTIDLALAFAAPAADTLRFYALMGVDVSDWEKFKCAVLSLMTPFVSLVGPFGVGVAVIVAGVAVALGGSSGVVLPPATQTCHEEYGIEVCEVPWMPMSTPMGVLHLASIVGIAQGLVFMGPMATVQATAAAKLVCDSSGFAWRFLYCAPIESEADVQAKALVNVKGPTVCDARILDDPQAAYGRKFTAGTHSIELFCTKPASQLPSYPCRLLVATTRGLCLLDVSAPPSEVPWESLKNQQKIFCMDDVRQHVHWTKWPGPDPDHIEIIHPDLALVLIDVTVAGLGAGEWVQLQADGQAIAAGMPGPLGFASVSGALDAESVSAELSLVSTGKSHAAPVTPPAIDAKLEFWRHAGLIGVIGSVHDVVGPAAGICWLATTRGLLRADLTQAVPVLIEQDPARGIHRLALTPYGLVTGGDDGLAIVDLDTGDMEALSDAGPVRLLARRGNVLHVVGGTTVQTFNLVARLDRRGRRWSLKLDPVASREVREVRSGVLAGRFLILQSEDEIGAHEIGRDGSLGAFRSIPSRSIRAVHAAFGSDTREAFVAEFDGRVALMRIHSATDSPDSKLETLDLPRLPWFVESRRTSNCLLRTRPDKSGVDVFKLNQRVDLMRREASIRTRV